MVDEGNCEVDNHSTPDSILRSRMDVLSVADVAGVLRVDNQSVGRSIEMKERC